MGSKLHVYKNYRISNAQVKTIPEKYQRDGLKMQWIINSQTVLEEFPDQEMMIPTEYDFEQFSDLGKYIVADNQGIDIPAIVVEAFPPKLVNSEYGESKVQKLVLMNENMQITTLSIWNDFITNEGKKMIQDIKKFPVIIAHRLKVRSFNGIELSTKLSSVILVNPPIEEANRLKNWVQRNQKRIQHFVSNKLYVGSNVKLELQPNQPCTFVANILPSR